MSFQGKKSIPRITVSPAPPHPLPTAREGLGSQTPGGPSHPQPAPWSPCPAPAQAPVRALALPAPPGAGGLRERRATSLRAGRSAPAPLASPDLLRVWGGRGAGPCSPRRRCASLPGWPGGGAADSVFDSASSGGGTRPFVGTARPAPGHGDAAPAQEPPGRAAPRALVLRQSDSARTPLRGSGVRRPRGKRAH